MRECGLLFIIFAIGCGSSSSQPKVEVGGNSIPSKEEEKPKGEMTTSPEYLNWAQFPVGTEIVRKDVTSSKEATVTSMKTWKLVELKADELTLEWQVTTERADGTYKAVNPTNRTTVRKSFQVPNNMKVEDFAKPSLNAKKVGEEEIKVLGQTLKATVFEWKNSTEGGEMIVKAWMSDSVPGRVVRQEMKVSALGRTTLDELVEIKKPEKK